MKFRDHFLVVVASISLLACAGPTVDSLRTPVPEALLSRSSVPGYSKIRYWGDDPGGISPDSLSLIAAQQSASGNTSPNRSFLAVSGGGSDGAFGAGLLSGWTSTGERPEFTVVTGISTGSLIAPFAFLGPPYDEYLKKAYTEISGEDIFERRGLFSILRAPSVADSTPLRHLVERYVTDEMLAAIAREHARGRRLLIGTTHLDAGRPVVWDIGAIASSQVPTRRTLVQDILVASASIPGVFPPVKIKVEADGEIFDEMHVDGGTSNQAFLFPSNFSVRDIDRSTGVKRNRTLYVLRNGKVTPQYSAVRPRLSSIAGRSIGVLIKAQGTGDLYRMYTNALRDGMAFRVIWIPDTFTMKEPSPFDPDYMNALFEFGYEMGRSGVPWQTQPP